MAKAKSEFKSIMPLDMKGVGFGWGLSGVGKSYLFGRAENPKLTCYLDFDDGKGEQLHALYNYAMYRDVNAEVANKFGQFYKAEHVFKYLPELFDSVEKDRYTYCFIDNIDLIEKSLRWEVRRDPDGYGISKNKSGISNAITGAFGGVNPAVHDLVSGLVNTLHSKGIRFVGATAHFKQQWSAGGPIPNKYEAKGVERWHQMSILSLVVIPNHPPNPIPPAATVQKEALGLGTFDEVKGKYSDVQRRLPLRLPIASFDAIYRYLKHPADLNNPAPGEVPTIEDIDPYSKRFSRDQLEYMKLAAQLELSREAERDSFVATDDRIEQARTMLAEGKSAKQIIAELGLKMNDLAKAGLI